MRLTAIHSCLLTALLLSGASPAQAQLHEQAQALADPDREVERIPGARANLSAANALVSEQKYDEAEAALAELQEDYPNDPRLLLMRGEVLLAISKPEAALELLKRSADLDPDRPRVHFSLGTAYASTGDSAGALAAFEQELAHNDAVDVQSLVRLNRSLLFQQAKRWNEAIVELRAVLKLEPERVEVYGDLVSLQLQAGKTAEAAATLKTAAEAGFSSAQHYYSLGARFFRDEEYETAVTAFGQALAIEPEMAVAERSLAAALEKLDRQDEALEHLQRYLDLSPGAWDADAVRKQLETAKSR